MIRNYLVTALRRIAKNKLASAITVIGFSIGIACALFIFLYVQYELSFDKFLPGHERIYRIVMRASTFEGGDLLTSNIAVGIKDSLQSRDSGIAGITQMLPGDALLGYDNRFHYEQNTVCLTDSSFLKVFPYPLSSGNPDTALEKPMSLLLTPEMALKYFGAENPIGKTISFTNNIIGATPLYFTVTGILKSLPANSSFQLGFLANCPYETIITAAIAYYSGEYKVHVDSSNISIKTQTFVRLKNRAALPLLTDSLAKAARKLSTPDLQALYRDFQLTAERLDDIYLFSKVISPQEKRGNLLLILLLAGLGVIVILIACINVINLTTARAMARAKEIGIRKALGASRFELVVQYLVESVLLSFFSLWIALVIVELGLPVFNSLVQRDLVVDYLHNPSFLCAVVGFSFLIGILSGIYPAFHLSSAVGVRAMRGLRARKAMVVLQFVFSIGLFIASSVILREYQGALDTDAGFSWDDVLMARLNFPQVEKRFPETKKAVLAVPGVLGVTASSFAAWKYGDLIKDFPVYVMTGTQYADVMVVDPDYLRLHGISLIKGEDFTADYYRPNVNQLIINEAAKKKLGLDINGFLFNEPLIGRVIGVVKNFDYLFPSGGIRPLILTVRSPFLINTSYAPAPVHLAYMLVKMRHDGRDGIRENVKSAWEKVNAGYSFEYMWADADMQRQVDEISRSTESVLVISTVLTFLLSGLGLFGLASFEMERRTKEIGIRKAIGATSLQIVGHFVLGFLRLTGLANVIAWPATFGLVKLVFGLIQYPHALAIGPVIFIEAGLISVVVTIVTVGSQTWRAASENPVNTLRYE